MTANDQIVGRLMKVAIIATALPLALILIDHFLWSSPSLIGSSSAVRRTLYFPRIVVETALLAWVAGRFLGVTLFGWFSFMARGTRQHSCLRRITWDDEPPVCSLATTVISAQIGSSVAWSILATWPCMAAVLRVSSDYRRDLSHPGSKPAGKGVATADSTMAGLIVAAVCFTLRLGRFQMLNLSEGSGSERDRGQVFRFGVKDMLVWTAALAPLMVVLRGLEMISLRRAGMVDVYPAGLICGCIALITLAALWLTLGSGMLALRAVAFMMRDRLRRVVHACASQGWLAQSWALPIDELDPVFD